MKFVLNRDEVFESTLGHAIGFVKDVPTHVPPVLYREVKAIGALPEEELPEEQKPAETAEPQDQLEREQAVVAVFEKLVLANKSGDFTAGGLPKDKAMERELGWAIDSKETAELWKKFKTGELK